jgi:hypothetical protein
MADRDARTTPARVATVHRPVARTARRPTEVPAVRDGAGTTARTRSPVRSPPTTLVALGAVRGMPKVQDAGEGEAAPDGGLARREQAPRPCRVAGGERTVLALDDDDHVIACPFGASLGAQIPFPSPRSTGGCG